MERENVLVKILHLVESFIQKVIHFSYFRGIQQVSEIDFVFFFHTAIFTYRCGKLDLQL